VVVAIEVWYRIGGIIIELGVWKSGIETAWGRHETGAFIVMKRIRRV